MHGYIYKTTNLINGRPYVGQHHGDFEPTYRGTGYLIKRALSCWGTECFVTEFVCGANCQEELDALEIEHIANIRRGIFTPYNILPGGRGITLGAMSKMKVSMNTPERKAFMSALHKGKVIMPKQRLLQSIAMTGRRASQATKDKMSKAQSSRPAPSDATKEKLRMTWSRRKAAFKEMIKENPNMKLTSVRATSRRGEINIC